LRSAVGAEDDVTKVAMSVCLPDAEPEKGLRLQVAVKLRAIVNNRAALVRKYPIVGAEFPRLETHSGETVRDVWGAPANPVDTALHHKAMLRVWRRTMKAGVSMTIKEALADKEYRKRGGTFAFPSPMDTFIRGLHRRTIDLHQDWKVRLQRETSGEEARREAVAEMLLRLRWDDRDQTARKKLSAIVGRIWDDLEGVDLTSKPPISSALWLDDTDGQDTASAAHSKQPESYSVAKQEAKTEACERNTSADKVVAPTVVADEISRADADAEGIDSGHPAESVASSSDAWQVVEEPVTASAIEQTNEERRPARDGQHYARAGFLAHYGAEHGEAVWDEAGQSTEPCTVAQEAAELDCAQQGDGGAVEGNDDRHARGAEAARAAMDAGLQTALDSISVEVRRRMDAFAADARAGSKLKLPLNLSAKQRKAAHLWAEIEGLSHKSFGYRGRRRLHLSIPMGEDALGDAVEAHDFDDEGMAARGSDWGEEDEGAAGAWAAGV